MEFDKYTQEKINFINNYKISQNAASGSKYDANANVTEKNIATLGAEIPKKDAIRLQRAVMYQYLIKLYGKDVAEQYIQDLNHHIIYRHDETSSSGGFPYCAAITMYPFLLNGLKDLGGSSEPPKHIESFIGSFINLAFLVAGQFVGAIATPEFLTYMDYFLRKDFGEDYIEHLDKIVEYRCNKNKTLKEKIESWFAQVVYTINQPAGARGYQSIFWNIAYFDEFYFKSIFNNFIFPDGNEPKWETTKELQKMFMKWFNKERTKCVLTFPVETMNLLVDKETQKYKDEETAQFACEMWAEGHSFFMYQSDSADALSSCCFEENTKVKVRDLSTGEIIISSFKELAARNKEVWDVSYKNDFVKGKLVILSGKNHPLYRIQLGNESEIIATDNHIHVLRDGSEKFTNQLKIGDVLLHNDKQEGVIITNIEKLGETDKVYCFEMLDKTCPYFTLANGIITHNCRLRNAVEDNTFSYTLGAGGIETGSKAVITLNLNRIVQDWAKDKSVSLKEYLYTITKRVHKYLTAFNEKLWDDYKAGLLTVFKAGFIDLDRQFLTIGINGFVEAAEFLGIEINPHNPEYQQLAEDLLQTIENCNLEDRSEHVKFNTEFVPAENLAVKNYNWDKEDGYKVPENRNLYNSYFYIVEDKVDPVSKFYYQGKGFADKMSGGVALHNNLDEHLTKEQYRLLMDVAARAGCNYFTYNIPNTICNKCGHISKHHLDHCENCGSEDVDYATRIIGYLKRISNFSAARQKEAAIRYYGKVEK